MRIAGRVFRSGGWWAVEMPVIDVYTQGRTKADGRAMAADAVEALVDRPGFRVDVLAGPGEHFEVTSRDQASLIAFLLRRLRHRSRLTLAQAAARLGASSVNAYARYEQGRAVPTLQKLTQLFAAVSPAGDFVIDESRVPWHGG